MVWEESQVLCTDGGEYNVNVFNAAELYALKWFNESIYVQYILQQ